MTEQKIAVEFRPDQLDDVIDAVTAYADDLANDREMILTVQRQDRKTADDLTAQETRLQKLAYWLQKIKEEAE